MSMDTATPADAVTIDPEQMCFIIIKAKELDAKVDPDDPDSGSNPGDDKEIDILEDLADDPTLQELLGALEGLNADQLVELLAMCWLGRGDYEVGDWSQALADARETANEQLSNYLVGTPLLGDFLEEGYSQLGYSCGDYELERL